MMNEGRALNLRLGFNTEELDRMAQWMEDVKSSMALSISEVLAVLG